MASKRERKKYLSPEVKVVELSFTKDMLGVCHSGTVSWPQQILPPLTCAQTTCQTPP